MIDAVFLTASTKASLSVWHQRFGHLNMQDINSISKNNNIVDGMKIDTGEDDNNDCGSCALGKMHRLPFPKKSEHRAKSALELIHTDLCGPMQVASVGGSRYLLSFIDDYSRYSVICLLKQKSEVLGKFKEFVQLMKNKKTTRK